MKKSVKIMAITVGGIIVLGSLAGCGSSKTSTTSSGGATTITYWSGNSHSEAQMKKIIDEYNNGEGKKEGIKIDYQVKGNDSLSQSMELAYQSGTAPDFIMSGDVKKDSTAGNIMAIDDLPGSADFIKKYKDKNILRDEIEMYKGKTYSVPTEAQLGGLLYNKDMFKAAGIVDEKGEAKPPKTFTEMREDAKKLTNASEGKYGIIYPLKWSGFFSSDIVVSSMSYQGFVDYNPKDGKFEYDGLKPVIEAYLGMKEDGSVYPGADGIDNDSARSIFAEGVIGMKIGFQFDVGVLTDQFPAKCDWDAAAYPVPTEGAKQYKQRMDFGSTPYVNAKTKVDKAKMFTALKFFASDEFIKKSYEAAIAIPYDFSIVKDDKLSNAPKGWESFAKMVDISTLYPAAPQTDTAGLKKPETIFGEDIYSGKVSVDEGIKEMNENMNKAVDNYYSVHKDEDKERYHNTSYSAPTQK